MGIDSTYLITMLPALKITVFACMLPYPPHIIIYFIYVHLIKIYIMEGNVLSNIILLKFNILFNIAVVVLSLYLFSEVLYIMHIKYKNEKYQKNNTV